MLKDIRKQFNNTKDELFLIDVGHGGTDTGTLCYDGSFEKDFNLKLGLKVYKKLKPWLKNVRITRIEDIALNPSVRVKLIKDICKNYKIVDCWSFHGNAFLENSRGAELFLSGSNSFDREFCEIYLKDYCAKFNLKNRGVKTRESETNKGTDYYYMHRNTPSNCLTKIWEWGFVKNREDWKILKTEEFQEQASDQFIEYVLARRGIKIPKIESKINYIVQCGAFNDYDNAIELVKKLDKLGIESFIKKA